MAETDNVIASTAGMPQGVLNAAGADFLGLAGWGGEACRCMVCGRELPPGTRYRHDRYRNASCTEHSVRFCVLCGRMMKPGAGQLLRGLGHACSRCATERSYAELTAIVGFVNTFFVEHRLFVPAYEAVLLTADEMYRRHYEREGCLPLGVAIEGTPHRVELLASQSRVGIAATLAHELLHLWQYHRGIKAPRPYAEGFCNLGSFLVTSRIRRSEALVRLFGMIENPDPVYGRAFRELKVMYDVYGWRAVIAAMKRFATEG